MSDQNLLRLIIAVLGAVWLAWIAWSHRRRRVQGERLQGGKVRARGTGRREPSLAGSAIDEDAATTSARSAAVEAMENAQARGRPAPPFDADLAAELEKLSQEIAGHAPEQAPQRGGFDSGGADLGTAPESLIPDVAPRHAAHARGRVEPTFGGTGLDAGVPHVSVARPGAARPSQVPSTAPRSQFGARGETPHDRLVTLFVVAAPGEEISGYELVVATEKCGLEFGAMDVYHRLVDGRPEAGPVFSVANMTKPGSFDLTRITELSTPGLTFFMTLPGPMRALDAWDTLLPTAQRMAELLGAQVLDEEHNALGRQRIQHIRDDLRGYDRTLERQTIKRTW